MTEPRPTTHKPGVPRVTPERTRRDWYRDRDNQKSDVDRERPDYDVDWKRPDHSPLHEVGEGERPTTPKPGPG